MLTEIQSLHPALTPSYFFIYLVVALSIGMAKAGLGGLGLAVVPVMALIFGAKESTGIILPMLIAADIMAVIHYHRKAVWSSIFRILPWVAIGILAGLFTGNLVNAGQFRIIMLTVVWAMLSLMVINDLRRGNMLDGMTANPAFAAFMGLTGGFATMIGNSAGPVFTLYFLAARLPKNEFVGTGAWLYLIMNTGKLPLQILVWKNIGLSGLLLNLISLPFIAAGIFAGIWLVRLFPERGYRIFIIVTTIATSFLLLI
jgi:uncharacterized membrane protein YfcA